MIVIDIKALKQIENFYKAFARRHQYDYSEQMMHQNIDQVINCLKSIDVRKSRQPMLPKYRDMGYIEYPFNRNGRGTKYDWYAEFRNEVINSESIIHIYEVIHKSRMHERITLTNRVLREIIYESVLAAFKRQLV